MATKKKTTDTIDPAIPAEEVEVKPVTLLDQTLLTEEQRGRLVGTRIVDNYDGITQSEQPIYLEEVDAEAAKKYAIAFLLDKIVKGTCNQDEIERYKALIA